MNRKNISWPCSTIIRFTSIMTCYYFPTLTFYDFLVVFLFIFPLLMPSVRAYTWCVCVCVCVCVGKDLLTLLVLTYALLVTFYLPPALAIFQAYFWNLLYAIGIRFILYCQSTTQWWLRRKIYNGGHPLNAFEDWKSLYNLSLTMAFWTFLLAAGKSCSLEDLWKAPLTPTFAAVCPFPSSLNFDSNSCW